MGHDWKLNHAYVMFTPFDDEYINEALTEEQQKQYDEFIAFFKAACEDTQWEFDDSGLYGNPSIICNDARGYEPHHIHDLEEIIKKVNNTKYKIVSWDRSNANNPLAAFTRFTSIPEDNDYLYSTRVFGEDGKLEVETMHVDLVKNKITKYIADGAENSDRGECSGCSECDEECDGTSNFSFK